MGVTRRPVPGMGARRCPVCALDPNSVGAARRFKSSNEIRLHLFHAHSDTSNANVKSEAVVKLKRQLLKGGGKKTPHVCNGCSKMFSTNQNLRRHMRSGACKGERQGADQDDPAAEPSSSSCSGINLDKTGNREKVNRLMKVVFDEDPEDRESPSPAPVDGKQLIETLVADALWPSSTATSPTDGPIKKAVEEAIKSLSSPPEPSGASVSVNPQAEVGGGLLRRVLAGGPLKAECLEPQASSTPIEKKCPVKAEPVEPSPDGGLVKRALADTDLSSPFAPREKTRKLTGVVPMSPIAKRVTSDEGKEAGRPASRVTSCPQCSQRLDSSTSLWSHMKRVHTHPRKNGPPAAAPGAS